jgi:hypothetical protein
MGKLSFLAGLAAGYVLGARAGRQRYEQIRRTSEKVWNSDPVRKQVENAKDVAKTKAAPVVADMVADAARATGEKLRQGRTIASEAIHSEPSGGAHASTTSGAGSSAAPGSDPSAPIGSGGPTSPDHADAWSAATRPTGTGD